jgi:hypothetical protein
MSRTTNYPSLQVKSDRSRGRADFLASRDIQALSNRAARVLKAQSRIHHVVYSHSFNIGINAQLSRV